MSLKAQFTESRAKVFASCQVGRTNMYTNLCWSAIVTSLIRYAVRQAWLDHVCFFKWRQTRTWSFLGNYLTASDYASAFVVTWSSHDHHLIIWTNETPADVLLLSPRVNCKFIHVDRSDRKMSMPPELNTEVFDIKTEPIATQFAIRSPPYLRFWPII